MATFSHQNPALLYIAIAFSFVLIIVLACVPSVRRKSPQNLIFLGLFTLCESWLIGQTIFFSILCFQMMKRKHIKYRFQKKHCWRQVLFARHTRSTRCWSLSGWLHWWSSPSLCLPCRPRSTSPPGEVVESLLNSQSFPLFVLSNDNALQWLMERDWLFFPWSCKLQFPNFKFQTPNSKLVSVNYWSGALICILMIFSVAGFIAGFFPEVAWKLDSVSSIQKKAQ